MLQRLALKCFHWEKLLTIWKVLILIWSLPLIALHKDKGQCHVIWKKQVEAFFFFERKKEIICFLTSVMMISQIRSFHQKDHCILLMA